MFTLELNSTSKRKGEFINVRYAVGHVTCRSHDGSESHESF